MEKTFIVDNKEFKVVTNDRNTNIEDSYRIKKRGEMKGLLALIGHYAAPTDAINVLDVKTMVREWRAHNLLYAFGIERKRTASVDLNVDNSKFTKFCYFVLSCLYLH